MPGSHLIAQTSRIPRRGPTISRASSSLQDAARPRRDTIFTSGGRLPAVSWVLGVPHDKVYGFGEPVFNCSVTRRSSRGQISLSNFNDTAHPQLLTSSWVKLW